MKIGFDAKRLFRNYTGLGNYSRTIVRNLHQQFEKHDYFLYSPSIEQNDKTSYFFNKSNIHLKQPNTSFKAYWRTYGIKKDLIADQIDIYHGLSHELPIGISKSKISSVVTIHDLIFKHYPDTYKPIDRFIYDRKFRYACHHADVIIAISESTKRDIVHFYNIHPDKIRVIYQACDPIFYQLQTNDQIDNELVGYDLPSSFMLYVGSVIPRKNLHTIIDAMAQLPKEDQLPLVIVGSGGKYKESVKAKVVSKHLEHTVIWLSNIDTINKLQALYQKAAMVIYPSVYEGFGLPVVEAMLSNTPVITSNVSSMPEAGGSAAYLVDPLRTESMVHAISDILQHPDKRSQMISEGRSYALKQFNGQKLAEELMSLYKSI